MSANTYLAERERSILENAVVGIAGAGGLGSNCAMQANAVVALLLGEEL